MKTRFRKYNPDSDFMLIRQFLIDTFALYDYPFNWGIERWNMCRYHVIPMHTLINKSYFGIPTNQGRSFRDELPLWESSVGIWEDNNGNIVAVAHSENEEPGEAWIQIHPDYTSLYDEMVDYIERNLADRIGDLAYVKIYINSNTKLEEIAANRGYRKIGKSIGHLEYKLNDIPEPVLPNGFKIKSVADEDDPEKRRIAKSIAFGGRYSPSLWLPVEPFVEIQNAPDYEKNLDLFVVAPNGDYASFCTIWLDKQNHYANFEPVGTHREYQGLGLAKALIYTGFKIMKAYGATRTFMDDYGNPFYYKIGFAKTPHSYNRWIKYFTS